MCLPQMVWSLMGGSHLNKTVFFIYLVIIGNKAAAMLDFQIETKIPRENFIKSILTWILHAKINYFLLVMQHKQY